MSIDPSCKLCSSGIRRWRLGGGYAPHFKLIRLHSTGLNICTVSLSSSLSEIMLELLVSLIKIIGYCFSPIILFIFRLVSRKPPPRPDFKSDIVLITGGASGLGRELVEEYCKHGGIAVIWDISETALQETREYLVAKGFEVHTYVVDCSDSKQVYDTATKVREEVGNVSVLVNNAGINRNGFILDLDDTDIERVYKINTLAHYWVSVMEGGNCGYLVKTYLHS